MPDPARRRPAARFRPPPAPGASRLPHRRRRPRQRPRPQRRPPRPRRRRPRPVSAGTGRRRPGRPPSRPSSTRWPPGAIAAQKTYGVPAAVTIAQAIEESGWGQSTLATQDHNLFGIKGTGPAGSVSLPTQEYQNGQWVTISAQFRVYHDVAQSIDDHGRLLATSGYYTAAMAASNAPDQFAQALTGVYATDPSYGAKLISLMRRYNLYRFDAVRAGGVSPRPPATGYRRRAADAEPISAPRPERAHRAQRSSAPTATPATRASTAPGTRVSSPAVKPSAIATPPSVTTPLARLRRPPRRTPRQRRRALPPSPPRRTSCPSRWARRPPSVSPLPTSHATIPAASVGGHGVTPFRPRPAGPRRRQPTGRVPHPFATPQTATPQNPAAAGRRPPGQRCPAHRSPRRSAGHRAVRRGDAAGRPPFPASCPPRRHVQHRRRRCALHRHGPAALLVGHAGGGRIGGCLSSRGTGRESGSGHAGRQPPGAPARPPPGRRPRADPPAKSPAPEEPAKRRARPPARKAAPGTSRRSRPRCTTRSWPRPEAARAARSRCTGTWPARGIPWKVLAACDWMQCEARSALLAGAWREAGRGQPGRHHATDQVRRARRSAPTTCSTWPGRCTRST